MTRVQRVACSAALLVLFTGAPASAQGTAQLNGRVTDESGAVLLGVTVTATQTETGASALPRPTQPERGASRACRSVRTSKWRSKMLLGPFGRQNSPNCSAFLAK